MPTLDIKSYVIAGLIAALLGAYVTHSITVSGLEKQIDKLTETNESLNQDIGTCKANRTTLKGTIDTQNAAIRELALDVDEAERRWANRVPEKVYVTKWKTKYVDKNTTVEVDYAKCENDQRILNSISKYGY